MKLYLTWRAVACAAICLQLGCDAFSKSSGKVATGPASTTATQGIEKAATQAIEGVPWFTDATQAMRLRFIHDAGPTTDYFMPQAVGSGAAILDMDGDGRLDIYLIQNGGPKGQNNQLFRQQEDHTFVDVSASSGLDVAGWGMGAAAGDINNDGRVDLALFEYGRTRLFLNEGAGRFVDISEAAQVRNPLWAVSGAFFDYDRDGWLDLVVVNYVDYDPSWPCYSAGGVKDYCAPSVFTGTSSKLFHNRGAMPTEASEPAATPSVQFEDVSVVSGIGGKTAPGLGVFCADLTGDGWDDILVANDGKNNLLWVNQQNGEFVDEAVVRGLACNGFGRAEANMGLAVGDLDENGLLDVFSTHLTSETHTFWRQDQPGLFVDHTHASGLSQGSRGTGFGTVAADFDLDGDLDLAAACGRVARGPESQNSALPAHWRAYAEHNQLFRNEGQGTFAEASHLDPPFCGTENVARGLAAGDFDQDGRIDLLLTTIAGPAQILRNAAPQGERHWLAVRAWLPSSNRDALGALIRLRAGGQQQMRIITTSGSYGCSHDALAHFGLGEKAGVDSLEVRWPSGESESFQVAGVDRELVVRQGEGKAVR